MKTVAAKVFVFELSGGANKDPCRNGGVAEMAVKAEPRPTTLSWSSEWKTMCCLQRKAR